MKTLNPTIRAILSTGLVLVLGLARGQSPADGRPSALGSIPYSTVQSISSNDSSAVIVEKAAKVLPRDNQIAWMRLERTFFIHYGPNAFNGVEWGSGREDPSVFNPTALDANQWMSAVKNAGGNLVVLVCKHHDGFCLWPSRYTPQSVASSPWLAGKGDVVGAVAKAARAQGIKLGVYLSPADLYQLRTNPKNPAGYYGDGSSNLVSVIPTAPASFKTSPAQGRTPPAGCSSYTYEANDYNRYFLNQLYELLTEYGPIDEVWFDGANPDRRVPETYDRRAWYDLIRKLAPGAVIAVKGPDVRWVGNENGVGRTTEWSVIPLSASPDTFTWPDMGAQDLGSRAKLTPGSYLWWYPAEVNTTIINGWFWAANKRAKSAQQLIDVFYQSVGRNGNMLLNLSPDKRGLVPENQLASLSRMAQVVNDTFATDLAAGGKLEADSSNPTNNPSLALDKNLDTWWEAASGRTNATLTLTLLSAITFDVVSLQEAVEHRGQRIESVTIDTWNGTDWTPATELTTVGRRRIQRLPAPVTTTRIRIRINGSRLEPTLSEVGLFKQAVAVAAPAVSDRDVKGSVTLSNSDGLKMVFTIDGTAPHTNSPVYISPVSLPLGGTLQAACVTAQGRLGMVASKTFAGLSPIGWKVAAVDNQEAGSAANAIDGNAATLWQTATNAGAALPHFITIDMGAERRIAGFTYMPRQDGCLDGVVETFRFETSADGNTWTTNVASGRFGNIRNSPIQQEVTFAPITARFFRFTALQEINGNGWTSAAELSVLPAPAEAQRNSLGAAAAPAPSIGLKDAFVGKFLIGCAGDLPRGYSEAELANIKANYNIVTPENCMKPQPTHPSEASFNFSTPDALVKWCGDNNIKVWGHTLAWHAQTARWFFQGTNGESVTRELAMERLSNHIHTVVGRFKGKVIGWDVVNEAINDGGDGQTENLRNSPWLKAIGPAFLAWAFKWAHEADPEAQLYYNDYNIEQGAVGNKGKHASSMLLLKRLIKEGAPINGVGIQGHWHLNTSIPDVEKAIEDYESLGLKVSISELDVTSTGENSGAFPSGSGGGTVSADAFQRQAEVYAKLFDVFDRHAKTISRVTFWGISDRRSWRSRQRPLVYDAQLQPKPALQAILDVAKGK